MQKTSSKYLVLAPILVLIVVNILIGLATVSAYGESWDEPGNMDYGRHSIDNYINLFQGKPVVNYASQHLDQKGPVFFMLANLAERVAAHIAPGIKNVTVWHFLYFLSVTVVQSEAIR